MSLTKVVMAAIADEDSGAWGTSEEPSETVSEEETETEEESASEEHNAGIPPVDNRVGANGHLYKFVPCSKPRDYDPEASKTIASVELAIVGDANVGKTSILYAFVHRQLTSNMRATVGVDFSSIWLKSRAPHWDRTTQVSLYDCAGQERYQDVIPQQLRKHYGILLVFDTTNELSLKSLERWSEKIIVHNQHCCRMLVGNKMDLYNELPETSKWMSAVNWDDVQSRLLCDEGRFFVTAKFDPSLAPKVTKRMREHIDSMLVEMIDCAIERQEEIEREHELIDADDKQRASRYAIQTSTVNLRISHSTTKNNNCKC